MEKKYDVVVNCFKYAYTIEIYEQHIVLIMPSYLFLVIFNVVKHPYILSLRI